MKNLTLDARANSMQRRVVAMIYETQGKGHLKPKAPTQEFFPGRRTAGVQGGYQTSYRIEQREPLRIRNSTTDNVSIASELSSNSLRLVLSWHSQGSVASLSTPVTKHRVEQALQISGARALGKELVLPWYRTKVLRLLRQTTDPQTQESGDHLCTRSASLASPHPSQQVAPRKSVTTSVEIERTSLPLECLPDSCAQIEETRARLSPRGDQGMAALTAGTGCPLASDTVQGFLRQ
eukprot:scaffold2280_cov430-Prasinococcus_capsulatus_cf.AAC.16